MNYYLNISTRSTSINTKIESATKKKLYDIQIKIINTRLAAEVKVAALEKKRAEIQSKCKHRLKTYHYGQYERSEHQCDICGKWLP